MPADFGGTCLGTLLNQGPHLERLYLENHKTIERFGVGEVF